MQRVRGNVQAGKPLGRERGREDKREEFVASSKEKSGNSVCNQQKGSLESRIFRLISVFCTQKRSEHSRTFPCI